MALDSQTRLYAINNLDQILGDFSGSFSSQTLSGHRFLQDLGNAAIEYLDHVQGTLEDMNDVQQIVGSYGDGRTMHGYIATPVPEPCSAAIARLGVALLWLQYRAFR